MRGDKNGNMGSDSNSATQSPTGKRSRDPEDELFFDNFHNHKRYLSEMMASSLNGLKVGDPLSDNILDSPARSEGLLYARDEMSLQYSPMSEDSDDSRYCELPTVVCSSQSESMPSSPVSPCKFQRALGVFSNAPATSSYLSGSCSTATVPSSYHRPRSSDSEGRFPSSPSDICHSADLRRAALLRSVQMRTQPTGLSTIEMAFSPGQEPAGTMETDEQHCLEDEREYHIEECPNTSISGTEFNQEKSCRGLDMNLNTKGDTLGD